MNIKVVLRQGLAIVSLVIIGVVLYWFLLRALGSLPFELDLTAVFVATLAVLFVYQLRSYLFVIMGKAFLGQRYDYRRRLSDFASKIHNIFGLQEQGEELLTLVTGATGCQWACLLFPETDGEDFTSRPGEPGAEGNSLSGLRMSTKDPIVEYLRRERKLLTRQGLATLPEFRRGGQQETGGVQDEIELFVPLFSRDHLVAILGLAQKKSGQYSREDFSLLSDVAGRVAVSMEKEYLREQLSQREKRLSVINRSSAIITSSMDVPAVFDSLVGELRKVADVSWAAIVLVENSNLRFLSLATATSSPWKVGERIAIEGTATEWVVNQKKTVVESDLLQKSKFVRGGAFREQGIRSIAHLPLVAKGRAIGSLIVASQQPHAYSQGQVTILEHLASQIAMPIENARVYAEIEEKARIDDLTGLLNRRSLDEMMASEISRHSRYGGIFSLIILDLDSFKALNDNYGHLAGDRVLGKAGSAIKKTIRGADRAFRYGGDEFAILLPSTAINGALQVAERVRKQVASQVIAGHISVTVSLGLASWPTDGLTATEIIAAADAALYQAKRSGGNRSYPAANGEPK